MASLYVWLKFFHLVGLGVFLFGHGISAGASLAVRGRSMDQVSRALLDLSVRSHSLAFPGLGLLIATGVWMGFVGSWWRSGWIWTAIGVVVLLVFVMGALSTTYHTARRSETPVVLPRGRPLALTFTGAIGLLVLFGLMVFKPF